MCPALCDVLAEPPDQLGVLPFLQLLFQLQQREVDNVVMMDFRRREHIAVVQPELMYESHFVRGQVRRMRPEEKHLLLLPGGENLEI